LSRQAIVFAADARIFPAAFFAAERLAGLRSRADTDILVFTDSHAEIEKARLHAKGFAVRHALLPQGRNEANYYLRFVLLDLLAPDYQRVLYLDVDTWVEDALLFDLLDIDMRGHAVAAVRDPVVAFVPGLSERRRILGANETKYLNTGVLLVDSAQFAARQIGRRVDQAIKATPRPFVHRDQSALNAVLQGDWLELSPAFNLLAVEWDTFVTRVAPPAIVHFAGPGKPWSGPAFTLAHPARSAMERYFRSSAWPSFLPGMVNLAAALDPSSGSRMGNFDMAFPGRAAFLRYLRETEFADVAAGLSPFYPQHIPPS
jgi:lipopolysaccharide biosynthesis glycosyltransferase